MKRGREVELDPQVSPKEIKNREVELDPQVSPEEIKRREVELDPQVSPEEIKRREVVLDPQVSPAAQKRSRGGRWSWAQIESWTSFAASVVSRRRSYGHCLCDSVLHSSWDSNCVVL